MNTPNEKEGGGKTTRLAIYAIYEQKNRSFVVIAAKSP